MRTNATLQAEQAKATYKPYVTLHYYTSGRPSAGGGSWTQFDNLGSKDRIEEIYHAQEPFGSRAVLTLDNSDSSYDAYDLIGKWIRIGYGAVCSGGNEVSYPPYLVCNGQDFVSEQGVDKYIVYCEGAWARLQRWLCGPDDLFFNQAALDATLNDKTIRQIADNILERAGLDLGADIGTVDAKVDGWKPVYDCMAGQNGFDAIRNLLFYCRSVLVPRTDCLHFKYCQDADAVDYTYVSDATHYFRMSRSRSIYFKPMKVQVDDTVNDYTGSYAWGDGGETPAWDSSLGTQLWEDGSGVATSNADCALLAQMIVERAASERETGRIKANMNCLQEIYDKVTVTDNRGNTGGTGRVGGLYCHYKPGGKDPYYIEIRLGGLQRTLPGDMEGIADNIGAIGGKLPGAVLQKHSISPDILRQATQPSTNDIAWSSTGIANATWAAGTVYYQDGTSLSIDAGSKSDLTGTHLAYCIEGNSTIQWTQDWAVATAKGCTMLAMCVKGDADSSKAYIKVFSGKQDVLNALVLYADLILGKHIKAGEIDTDHLAALAVTADKIDGSTITFDKILSKNLNNLVQNGSFSQGLTGWSWWSATVTLDTTNGRNGGYCAKMAYANAYLSLQATAVEASPGQIFYGEIYVKDAPATTAGVRVSLFWYDNSGGYISRSDGTLTNVGTTYEKITVIGTAPANTAWVALTFLTDVTTDSGYWYIDDAFMNISSQIIVHGTPGGTRIEISGTEIAGYNGATKQFYLSASDGKAYAGAGAVILDAGGITVKGGNLFVVKDANNNNVAYISGIPNYLTIGNVIGAGVAIWGDATAGGINLAELPTSDPGVEGQLWNSSGTVKISAG